MTARHRRTSRRTARKQALDVLYQADLSSRDPVAVLQAHQTRPDPPDRFAAELVSLVAEHRAELDEQIRSHARGWSLERMPVVDRNILRLALAELLHRDDIPTSVAIAEAVGLAKSLSTEDSPRFVNGLLAAVARERGL